MFDVAQVPQGNRIQIDRSRDANLTDFGKDKLVEYIAAARKKK